MIKAFENYEIWWVNSFMEVMQSWQLTDTLRRWLLV